MAEKLEKTCQHLEEKVLALELSSRRNNLKFLNVEKQPLNSGSTREDCESTVLEICANLGLNLDRNDIERAHRLGHAGIADRPIIVKFLRYKVREEVFQAFRKLRNSGKKQHIMVVEDFPHEVVERRRQFKPILNAAFKSAGKYKAYLSVDNLVLNGQTYSVADLHKLPTELRLENLCTITKVWVGKLKTSIQVSGINTLVIIWKEHYVPNLNQMYT